MLSLFMVFSVCAEPIEKRFLSEVLGDAYIDYSITFSPAGDAFYFARAEGVWGKKNKNAIYYSSRENNQWSEPVVASFSGVYDDSDPHVSQDGKYLYFVSERPSEDGNGSPDIWYVQKDTMGDWGQPVRLPEPVNSKGMEASPRTTLNGDLYFVSDRKGSLGQADIFYAVVQDKQFQEVKNLGSIINSPTGEWNFDINPQATILIFEASHRVQNLSVSGDLYISFKLKNVWTEPQNIVELNTKKSDLYPQLMSDHVLYYSSNGYEVDTSPKIYSVDARALIEQYKETAVSQVPMKDQ
ncbi:hypothetical protein [Marinicella sp. W31]|uniref:hypothetical protein n=1 Tax=Marinicella sp. W31 TaxID=3023713 RepID=UPI00375785AE